MNRISDLALDLGLFKLDDELESMASQKVPSARCMKAVSRAFEIHREALESARKGRQDAPKSKRKD